MEQDAATISLYQKELHKVREQDSQRVWTVPKPTITPSQFRKLILKRSKTLKRLQLEKDLETNAAAVQDLETNAAAQQSGNNTGTSTIDKEERKKEIQELLKLLKERRHGFVQVLKTISKLEQMEQQNSNQRESGPLQLPPQVETTGTDSGRPLLPPQVEATGNDSNMILNAETSNHGNSGRPPLPLRAETTTTDSGKMTKSKKRASDGSVCSQRHVSGSSPPLPPQVETTASDYGSMTNKINTPDVASGGRAVIGSNPDSNMIPNAEPSNQGNSRRPPLPLQAKTIGNDSGRMTRVNTPKRASDGSQRAVGGSNPNSQSRHVPWMNTASPLSSSQQQRTHSDRASTAVAGSPSQFRPTSTGSGQGPPRWMSSPGPNYTAPSPSRAPSDGTLARQPSPWREVRQPSPWREVRQPSPRRDDRQPSPGRDARRPTPSRFTSAATERAQGPSWISSPGPGYIAYSPSHAASNETLAFTDARQPSPWRGATQPSPWRDVRPPSPWS